MAFSFGSSSTGSGFSFGQSSSSTATAPSFSFGSTATQPQQQQSQSQPSAFSLSFAPSAQQPHQQQTPQQPSIFGQQQPLQQQQQPQQQQSTGSLPIDIQHHIQAIYDSYNPTSHNNRFQTFFYNKVDTTQVKQYVKPTYISSKQWDIAQKNNPDINNYIPVHCVGFNQLYKRIEQQNNATNKINDTLTTLNNTINDLNTEFYSSITNNIESTQKQHKYIQHKLLHIVNNITKIQSYHTPYLNSEYEYHNELNNINQLITKDTYYYNQIHNIQNNVQNLVQYMSSNQNIDSNIKLDKNTQNDIYDILNSHRHALTVTVDTIKKDINDTDKILQYVDKQQTNKQANTNNNSNSIDTAPKFLLTA